MNNQDNFEEKIGILIPHLPEYEPDKAMWGKIEAQLQFEEKLDNQLLQLPEFEFKEDIWAKISDQLNVDVKAKPSNKIKKFIIYSLSAAAAIVLLFGLSSILSNKPETEINYSQETVSIDEQVEISETVEFDPIKLLDQNCLSVPEICSSPEFIEKKDLLLELDTEYRNISEVINRYGESPELIKSLIKIENLKSEIIKDLIKKINS